MSDVREALVALIRSEYAPMSTHDPRDGSCQSCPWPLHEMPPEDIADAILAEFDVTPRGVHSHDIDPACPETRLPDGSLRGACTTNVAPPTVKPSVEDVARALWELAEQEADTTGGAIDVPWSALDSLTQGLYRADAEDLLALLPGRTETEVKAEAWGEVADYLDRTNAPSIAEAARRDNPYRKEQS